MPNLSQLNIQNQGTNVIPVNGVQKTPLKSSVLKMQSDGRTVLKNSDSTGGLLPNGQDQQSEQQTLDDSQKITVEELGNHLRQKNPDVLAPLTDREIGERFLMRRPELQKVIKSEQTLQNQPQEEGFLSGLAKGIATPFAKWGVTGVAALDATRKLLSGDVAGADRVTQEGYNLPWLGQVKPNKIGTDIKDQRRGQGIFNHNTLDTIGTGAEIATYGMGGGEALNLGKQAAYQGFKQLAIQGAKEGAIIGALGGGASALQDEKAGAWDVVKSALGGAAMGGALGSVAAPLGRAATKEGRALMKANKGALTSTKLAEYVAPKVNKELSINAFEKGTAGIAESRVLKSGKIKASPRDIELAKSVSGVVDPKLSQVQNIDKLNAGIKDISENVVTPFLKENPAIYNENLLKGKFNAIKENKLGFLKTNEQSAKIYDAVIDQALEIAGKQEKKDMYGLWRSRVEFDKWVEQNFGDKVLKDEAARSARDEALKNVRNGMNDFIAEHTPNGQFKDLMKKLSDYYTVRGNLAEKAHAEGVIKSSKLQSFAKNHPYLKEGAKYAAGGVIGTAALNKLLGD